MNYELAKKLKDAGFPQKGRSQEAYYLNVGHTIGMVDADLYNGVSEEFRDAKLVYAPNLEDLIEATPQLLALHRVTESNRDRLRSVFLSEGDSWAAESANFEWWSGSTALLALAKLWLALHKVR
jgi:hypothetical protein